MEIRTEADSNDTTECSRDDWLSSGMCRFLVVHFMFCLFISFFDFIVSE